MREIYFDVESLSNVFTLCCYRADENHVDFFYQIDDNRLNAMCQSEQALATLDHLIHVRNRNFTGSVTAWNLREEDAGQLLARTFGLCDSEKPSYPDSRYPDSFNGAYRLVCDTDKDFDENIHPYLFGYNSYNYDTTMLAWLLDHMFDPASGVYKGVCAKAMRQFNDELFTSRFKKRMASRLLYRSSDDENGNYHSRPNLIRKAMLASGRYVDVARLNEKQQHRGLKRMLGMIGCQILESDLLAGVSVLEKPEQFFELAAYNVSDCVNLAALFHHPSGVYKAGFELKKSLLKTYPETIYRAVKNSYKPCIAPYSVRNDRLMIDSTSAQFAEAVLCPYDHISDIKAVSYLYPSKQKAREQGIRQVNVLEEARTFFYQNFEQFPQLCREFDAVYYYFKSLEGQNFNGSQAYLEDYGKDALPVSSLSTIPKAGNCLPYFNKDGSPSSCFVSFSTGGLHGAEYNKVLYESDMEMWQKKKDLIQKAKDLFPDPLELIQKRTAFIDGTEYTWREFIRPGLTVRAIKEMSMYERCAEAWKEADSDKPVLFKEKGDGTRELNKRYVFTSADMTSHEDFTSYYPNLLRQMEAFMNKGLGYDRYGEIFESKQKYGQLMKDESLSNEQRSYFATLREGTKLILNAASGAADTNYRSRIQLNNRILSMRIIGQLFTWRIGQAQTLAGARIISTNTDGLYSVLDEELNNKILKHESERIGVAIEPESLYLISKDANNRLEAKVTDDILNARIISASGGLLACRKGPDLTKGLDHPAIIDWALSEYLITVAARYKGTGLEKEFDDELGRNILTSAFVQFPDPIERLLMFQTIVSSSPASNSYVFAIDRKGQPHALQHYNRVFFVKDKTPYAVSLKYAISRAITPAIAARRKRDDERAVQHDPIALNILEQNGVKMDSISASREAAQKAVSGVGEDWKARIENRSLYDLDIRQINALFAYLDLERYLELLNSAFTNNWKN